jgi:hypothetical protein
MLGSLKHWFQLQGVGETTNDLEQPSLSSIFESRYITSSDNLTATIDSVKYYITIIYMMKKLSIRTKVTAADERTIKE